MLPHTTTKPTPRELDVLRLICQGLTAREIGCELGISRKTADSHRYSLMDKAGANNGIRLFRWALKRGYVSLD
jgi:DNA-binding NarL/FixJ family response regulator